MANPVGFSPASLSHVPYPSAAPAASGTDKVKKVSRDFEGVFLTNMFENMFEGLDDDGPFGAANGNGVWRSLLTEEYAKSIAASGVIGIADQIQRQLTSLQEKSQ
jgi:Rod binding domain-containing protein